MFDFDELKIYRGKDIQITPQIIVTQPTLDQIIEFGERRYFSAVHSLTAVGADYKWQLWDYEGIDYTKIDDYELFLRFIHRLVSSKKNIYKEMLNEKDKYEKELASLSEEDIEEIHINPLQLILKDIDLADFVVYADHSINQIVLWDEERNIKIDRIIYLKIVDVVRKIHGLKRNNELPGNETTKMDLIDDARDEALFASKKPYKSILKPLISALSVKSGMCGDDRIWNMGINMFFDNIKRANKIQDAELLLKGAYSGFANLKGIDKDRLDWTGHI